MRWVEWQTFFAYGHSRLHWAAVLLWRWHVSRILKIWIVELVLPVLLIFGHSIVVLAALPTMCPIVASPLTSPISTCLVAELLLIVSSILLIIWLIVLIWPTSPIIGLCIWVWVEELIGLDLAILLLLIMIMPSRRLFIAGPSSSTIKCLVLIRHVLSLCWIIWLLAWCTLIMLFLIIVH